MFEILKSSKGRKVLEIGCGEGFTAVQLAFCGYQVTGIDISPRSIEVAKKLASIHGLSDYTTFVTANVEKSEGLVFDNVKQFDVIWCENILHHLTDKLADIMVLIRCALSDGGLFIAHEPVEYAAWLKKVRSLFPIKKSYTPDQQPLRKHEFNIIRSTFPNLEVEYRNILFRPNVLPVDFFARVDKHLLKFKCLRQLAGYAVLHATK
jgi:SAM-dependent methyltransferase